MERGAVRPRQGVSFAQATSVDHPAAKIATLWGLIGITSWTDFAAFVAAIYSLVLLGEWLWKRVGRPLCERRGWIKHKARRKDDVG